jgi:pyrroloquinoline quinone biosynthesis protein B
VAGVLLTDAEFDHTLGLLVMREGSKYVVFGTASVLTTLSEHFPVRRLLRNFADVTWQTVAVGTPFRLDDRLTATAFVTGHKHPRYVVSSFRDEGAVVGYRLTDSGTGATAVYAPGVSRWDDEFDAEVSNADCVIIDGTLWTDDEMLHTGTGRRRGLEMGHLPMSGPGGTAARLAALPAKYKIYTHVNNTNPVLDESTAERRELAAMGIELGRAGLRVEL